MTEHRRREQASGPSSQTRAIPHEPETEKALLGASLYNPAALETLIRRTRPEDFYVPLHRRIAHELVALYDEGEDAIDLVVLAARLPDVDRQKLVSIQSSGGMAHVRYAETIHDLATKRRLIQAATKSLELGRDPSTDAHDAIVAATEALDEVTSSNGARTYSSLVAVDFASVIRGDLETEEAILLRRTDGKALLYSGKMHALVAEPSAGKSWLALLGAVEVLELGGAVVYIDYEDTAQGIARRLRQLGGDPITEQAADRFEYVRFDGPLGSAERHEIDRLLERLNPDLVVIDGVAEALARDGYDEDRNRDVVEWTEKLPRPVARSGAAVLMLDHVVKSRENRGRGGRGAGHKLAAVDGAAYELIVTRSFSRDQEGTSLVKIEKDRPGGVGAIGQEAATAFIRPRLRGETVEVELLSPHDPKGIPAPQRPTRIMAAMMREIEGAKVDLTPRGLKLLVRGPDKVKDAALEHLIADGILEERGGSGGQRKTLKQIRPYEIRDLTDDLLDEPPELPLDDGDPGRGGPPESEKF